MDKKIYKGTERIETNRNLEIDFSAWKENITKFRYSYFDFDKEKVSAIANKDLKDIEYNEARILVQALFPQYLVCSGIFDRFVLFEVKDGVRIDPPKYYYNTIYSFLNNDKYAAVNYLLDEIKDLFKHNRIAYSESWKKAFNEVE